MDALLARLPARMLLEWMAFFQLEPWGRGADDMGHAITAATVANANRGKGKKPAKVQEFLPKWGAKKGQSVDDMVNFAAMMTVAMGGQDLRESEE